jgi:hypothetical protein
LRHDDVTVQAPTALPPQGATLEQDDPPPAPPPPALPPAPDDPPEPELHAHATRQNPIAILETAD